MNKVGIWWLPGLPGAPQVTLKLFQGGVGVYDHLRVAAESSGPSERYVAALGFSELCRDDAVWIFLFS